MIPRGSLRARLLAPAAAAALCLAAPSGALGEEAFGGLSGAFVQEEPGGLPAPSAAAPGQVVIPDPDQFEATAPTDDPELEANVRKLAKQLRCPTCQALSIADSPSELAREMEGQIRERLQAGMSPEQVRESFVASYGEWVLLSPRPSGFNLLVYVLPFAALLLGGLVVVVGMRRWLAAPGVEEGTPADS